MSNDRGFLNKNKINGRFFIDTDAEDRSAQTQFTQSEIDEVKQRDDIAIDWSKAIIEPVEDDE